jgi:hypothetical protein
MKVAALLQLKTGDAVSGIVSRRLFLFRFYRVDMPELHEARTQTSTKADGVFWVPKANVLFLQQLQRVIENRPLPAGAASIPGPLTGKPPKSDDA